jgi:dihydrofolate reductase
MSTERLIGQGGGLPWRLPADLRHFKSITMGKPVLMGRKTHESIGKSLPGRENIVLTRDRSFRAEGCRVVHSMEDALAAAKDHDELMVIGGAEIYRAFLDRADRMYVTLVEGVFQGDTHFPPYDEQAWKEVQRDPHEADAKNPHAFTFLTYVRPSEATI